MFLMELSLLIKNLNLNLNIYDMSRRLIILCIKFKIRTRRSLQQSCVRTKMYVSVRTVLSCGKYLHHNHLRNSRGMGP